MQRIITITEPEGPDFDFRIEIPARPRPTLVEVQKRYPEVISIERDTSPERPVTMKLATVLRPSDWYSISGKEYESRLRPDRDLALGFQHHEWLLEQQQQSPAFMALLGKCYIDFMGIIGITLVKTLGKDEEVRGFPYCRRHPNGWGGSWAELHGGFVAIGRSALAELQ